MNRTQWLASVLVALSMGISSPSQAQTVRAADATPKKSKDDSGTPTAIGGGSGLVIGGIDVDTSGKSLEDARLEGWREAQREAWPALWARMSGKPANTAPRLPDSALNSMVSAIEVEREQLGGNRYVARLAVVFDRVRASSYLGRYANLASSPPFLLLPVLQDAATRQAHEPDSPWLQAWSRLRAGETPIDYVRIRPTPGDVILLNSWQADRRHLFLWRMLIDRYQVADVLIPELVVQRSYVGGPVTGDLTVRFGTSGKILGQHRISNAQGDVAALADEAVRLADNLYVAALRSGNLLPDPNLIADTVSAVDLEDTGPQFEDAFESAAPTIRVRVQTPDDATLQSIQRTVSSTPGVSAVRLQSLVLGGESTLEIVSSVSNDMLRYALDQRGLRLDGGVLRRRAATEAPLPPVVPVGEDQLQETEAATPAVPPAQGGPRSLLPGGR